MIALMLLLIKCRILHLLKISSLNKSNIAILIDLNLADRPSLL